MEGVRGCSLMARLEAGEAMQRTITVNLGNLVLSLSDAMDLASPLLCQHQQRTGFIVSQLAEAAGFSKERSETLFMAALLHDVGALTLEEKVNLHFSQTEDRGEHCLRGAILLETIPWFNAASNIVRFHHAKWNDWGESIDSPLVLDAQLLFLADFLERLIDRNRYILHQHKQIISDLTVLSGSSIHPQVLDLFMTICGPEEFWLDLCSARLYSVLLNEGPFQKTEIELPQISMVAGLFRNIIDFRSPFTSTHSAAVSATAFTLATIFGFTETEAMLMNIAGNLHDIGNVTVPSGILEKRGKLTEDEMATIKSHTYYTYHIIDTIGGIRNIAEWAAYHHEKLDGSGYPFHCKAEDLSTGARIMAVADIFTALSEDRPYRRGMSIPEINAIMNELHRDGSLDGRIVNLLLDNYDVILPYAGHKREKAREFYETRFLPTCKTTHISP
jgi:HD-GYP domain-containing protein (c-di-GMP phosphodiesterase class II)